MKDTKLSEEESQDIGGVMGIFNRVKSKVEDISIDYSVKSEFDKNNPSFSVYNTAGINNLLASFHAIDNIESGYIVALTDNNNLEGILSMNETDKLYYIDHVEDTVIEIKYKDTYYKRDGKKIYLGEIPEKVDVIRIDKNYYIKK
ncbi:MAG: hypothetical protein ACI35W_06340 [Anaeroplasmataceae bacterium]